MDISKDFKTSQIKCLKTKRNLKTFNEKYSSGISELIQRYAKATDLFLNDGRGMSGIKEIKETTFKVIAYGWETDSCHLLPVALLSDPEYIIQLEMKYHEQLRKEKEDDIARDLKTLELLEKKYRK